MNYEHFDGTGTVGACGRFLSVRMGTEFNAIALPKTEGQRARCPERTCWCGVASRRRGQSIWMDGCVHPPPKFDQNLVPLNKTTSFPDNTRLHWSACRRSRGVRPRSVRYAYVHVWATARYKISYALIGWDHRKDSLQGLVLAFDRWPIIQQASFTTRHPFMTRSTQIFHSPLLLDGWIDPQQSTSWARRNTRITKGWLGLEHHTRCESARAVCWRNLVVFMHVCPHGLIRRVGDL